MRRNIMGEHKGWGIVGAGAVASIALALSVTGSLSGFTASITNPNNRVTTGTLSMEEQGLDTDGSPQGAACTSDGKGTAKCTTVNLFGSGSVTSPLAPGGTNETDVVIKNTGTIDAKTFALAPTTACTSSGGGVGGGAAPTDFCDQVHLEVAIDGTTYFSGSLTAFAANTAPNVIQPLPAVAAGDSKTLSFTTTLPQTLGNEYQSTQAQVGAKFTFAA
ncbi:hypothetical protein IT072_20685 (plasmid) [Leifsonia sp. ZF2019]|uniref:hypothetical protein n=1 Tax=Leifsonia sp. ZF2019 TaxID=2781978 RepID=UPI001CBAFE40|nr:hypothetical protein [Leifsonia sp. ZF2019]UAJ81765.1 hypothetical protein IT072_20685 [Leifsonia sp. ZF2019]